MLIQWLLEIEHTKLKDLPNALNLSSKNKSFSRIVIEKYLNEKLAPSNLQEIQNNKNFITRTVAISKSYVPLDTIRLVDSPLIQLADEKWESSILNNNLNRILIIPFLVLDRNLGQPYRTVGKSFIWEVNDIERKGIEDEWYLFKNLSQKGVTPNTLQKRGDQTFLTEKNTQYIHMRPHSTKGKYELDKFGNNIRKMAFFLNKGYLRKLLMINK